VTIVHLRRDDSPEGFESRESATARYEIHIKGRVGQELAEVFEGLIAEVQPVETVLLGELVDQAALHGVIDRVQALGLELIEVRRLPENDVVESRQAS
jgi:hypothetical protein